MKNLKLAIIIMVALAIVLFMLIVWADISGITMASATGKTSSDEIKQTEEIAPTEAAIKEEEPTTYSSLEINGKLFDISDENLKTKVKFNLKYWNYLLTHTYLIVESETINIRLGPSIDEPVIKTFTKNSKLNYIKTLSSDTKWYQVSWQENNQMIYGYVSTDVVTKKAYQFDKMKQAIDNVEASFAKGKLSYISNYKNVNGYAPRYKGSTIDGEGNHRSQSAPGYFDPNNLAEFNYIPDGTLVRIISKDTKHTAVSLITDKREMSVPNRYVVMPEAVTSISKAIVVDRGNQNEAVFEKINGQWNIVSYSLATTGMVGKYQQPTPLGYYFGIEKRERFYYYKDGTTSIQGYAPYAVRFTGGAYIHGVPVNYKYTAAGAKIDPGKIEYSKSIGTIPLSHKCVRNYTSHAKFIYDWYTKGETIVIVIE